jgi:hypothetical protein
MPKGPKGVTLASRGEAPAPLRPNRGPTLEVLHRITDETLVISCLLSTRPYQKRPLAPTITVRRPSTRLIATMWRI